MTEELADIFGKSVSGSIAYYLCQAGRVGGKHCADEEEFSSGTDTASVPSYGYEEVVKKLKRKASMVDIKEQVQSLANEVADSLLSTAQSVERCAGLAMEQYMERKSSPSISNMPACTVLSTNGLYNELSCPQDPESSSTVCECTQSVSPLNPGTTNGLPELKDNTARPTTQLTWVGTKPVNEQYVGFNIQNKTRVQDLTPSQQENVKWFTSLGRHYWSPNLLSNPRTTGSQFFGGPDGTYVEYPLWNNKNKYYDVRTQQWYWEGSSKAKVVIIGIALDFHMLSQWNVLLKLVETFLYTFTPNDVIAVVGIGAEVKLLQCFPMGLINATRSNKDTIMSNIRLFSPAGNANHEAALKKVEAMLFGSSGLPFVAFDPGGAGRYQVDYVLFQAMDDLSGGVLAAFDELKARYSQFNVHSYVIGHETPSSDGWKKVACNNGGTYGLIESTVDPAVLFDNLAPLNLVWQFDRGDANSHATPDISVPFLSFNEYGKLVVAVTSAVYDRSVSPYKFLGVIGENVDMMTIVDKVLNYRGSTPVPGSQAFMFYNSGRQGSVFGLRGMFFAHPIIGSSQSTMTYLFSTNTFLNISVIESPEFSDNVLREVLTTSSSSGAWTFDAGVRFARGQEAYDGMANYSTQQTFVWQQVELKITDSATLPLPLTVVIKYERGQLCAPSDVHTLTSSGISSAYTAGMVSQQVCYQKTTDTPYLSPQTKLGTDVAWNLYVETVDTLEQPCNTGNADATSYTRSASPACYAPGKLYYATLQTFDDYVPKPNTTAVEVPICNVTSDEEAQLKGTLQSDYGCSYSTTTVPAYTTQVSYSDATVFLSPEAWGNPSEYILGRPANEDGVRIQFADTSQHRDERRMRSALNGICVEATWKGGGAYEQTVQVNSKYDVSVPFVGITGASSPCTVRHKTLTTDIIAQGPHAITTTELRAMSSFIEAFKRGYNGETPHQVFASMKAAGYLGPVSAVMVSTVTGANMIYPGYDLLGYLGKCLPGQPASDTSYNCSYAYSPSRFEPWFRKAESFWVESRLDAKDRGAGTADIDAAASWVVMPPSQSRLNLGAGEIIMAAPIPQTTTSMQRIYRRGSTSWNSTEYVGTVLAVKKDYAQWVQEIFQYFKDQEFFYCGRQMPDSNMEVRCLIIDDSGMLVLHPKFSESNWAFRPKYISELEPELAEVLELNGILADRSPEPQLDLAAIQYVSTKKLDFSQLPSKRAFNGAQSGHFNMVAVKNTNLAFIHITDYISHQAVRYCGILSDTCPNVYPPFSYAFEIKALCKPHGSAYAESYGYGQRRSGYTIPLSGEQLAEINPEGCEEEESTWWIWFIIGAGIVLVLVGIIAYVVVSQQDQDTQDDGRYHVGKTKSPPRTDLDGVELHTQERPLREVNVHYPGKGH